jgi:hypothetical protein
MPIGFLLGLGLLEDESEGLMAEDVVGNMGEDDILKPFAKMMREKRVNEAKYTGSPGGES